MHNLIKRAVNRGIKVLCAELQIHNYGGDGIYEANLHCNHTPEQYEAWLNSLDQYSYQGESGHVWFDDGSWLECFEHQGWVHIEKPKIPEYLNNTP